MRNHDRGRYWDISLNDVYGCTPISEGCRHCWAAAMAYQYSQKGAKGPFAGLVEMGKHGPRWSGETRVREAHDVRLAKGHDRIIALGFMTDLMHHSVPVYVLDRVLDRCANNPKDTFLLTTKRPQKLAYKIPDHHDITRYHPNLRVMISAETQHDLNFRIKNVHHDFGKVYISAEPLLDRIDLNEGGLVERIAGVIAGGDSSVRAKPMRPEHIVHLRDQCAHYGIPFYFKSWGRYMPCRDCNGKAIGCHCEKTPWPGWAHADRSYPFHRELNGKYYNSIKF